MTNALYRKHFSASRTIDPIISEAIEFCEKLPWIQLKHMGIERRIETSYFPGQTIVVYPPYPALPRNLNEKTLFQHLDLPTSTADQAFNLYAHVPFCTGICTYCSYARTATDCRDPLIVRYVDALCRHRDRWLRRLDVGGERVNTVFIGGGTPTLLSTTQLTTLISGIPRHLTTETTVETDPEMASNEESSEKLMRLREIGVNRVSMGVETFDDAIASQLKRRGHEAIYSALTNIRKAGIDNINIDLIYGIPEQSFESWLETLQASIDASVPSITAYNYKLKPGSIDYKRVRRHGTNFHDEYFYRVVVMQRMAQILLTQNGYANSNVNWYTLRNSTFRQQGEKYNGSNLLGLGPSTYSYVGGAQFLSSNSLRSYLDIMDNNGSVIDRGQILDLDEQAHRRVIFGLKGNFNPDEVLARCSRTSADRINSLLQHLECLGLVEYRENRLSLSERGVLFANELCALFYSPSVIQRLTETRSDCVRA